MLVRRVVTGLTPEARSSVVVDEAVEPITMALAPGAEFHRLWGCDQPPSLPTDGAAPAVASWFPPPGGARFAMVTLPASPTAPPSVEPDAAVREAAEKLPGLLDTFEDDMVTHTSDTIDLGFVVSGEVLLDLDEGPPVHLRAGDCYVQNGTRHRWRNPAREPCTIAVAMVGARREPSRPAQPS